MGLRRWINNFITKGNRYTRKCTCGEREECTVIFYSTRGGSRVEGGLGKCGAYKKEIEKLLKYIPINKSETMEAKLNKNEWEDIEIVIPDELLDELDWRAGDDIGLEVTEICEDDKEHKGIVLSNLSKLKK